METFNKVLFFMKNPNNIVKTNNYRINIGFLSKTSDNNKYG